MAEELVRLYGVASDDETAVLDLLTLRAGIVWHCRCGWHNGAQSRSHARIAANLDLEHFYNPPSTRTECPVSSALSRQRVRRDRTAPAPSGSSVCWSDVPQELMRSGSSARSGARRASVSCHSSR